MPDLVDFKALYEGIHSSSKYELFDLGAGVYK